jgi:hypothetical protein
MKLKRIFALTWLSFSLIYFPVKAQTENNKKAEAQKNTGSQCNLKDLTFDCPEDFVKDDEIGDETLIFKSSQGSLLTYLFISASAGFADKEEIQKRIAAKFSSPKSKEFVWKKAKSSFFMSLKSEYKKGESSLVGFGGDMLLNLITRQFLFKNREIHLGYVYKMKAADPKAQFENLLGGENAVGCNAVATLLNSITQESKEKKQYCYLQLKLAALQK